MSKAVRIMAHVSGISEDRIGDWPSSAIVEACYESGGTLASVAWRVPLSEVSQYYLGQRLTITIEPEKEGDGG